MSINAFLTAIPTECVSCHCKTHIHEELQLAETVIVVHWIMKKGIVYTSYSQCQVLGNLIVAISYTEQLLIWLGFPPGTRHTCVSSPVLLD